MSRYRNTGLRIDEVEVGAEYRTRYPLLTVSSSRVRVDAIERVPEVHWRHDSRKVRKALVSWLNEDTGEVLTVAASVTKSASHVAARDLVETWAEHAKYLAAVRARHATQDEVIKALGLVGVNARRPNRWADNREGITVDLTPEEGLALAKRLERGA